MRIEGVQVGQVRMVLINRRAVETAIRKTKVSGPVAVMPLGLTGDEQADHTVHGGLDKAIYAYPSEHYGFWREQRVAAGVAGIDDQLDFGSIGENLTISGLLENEVWVGDVLEFPDCTLRVEQPREPCFKFNAAMGFNTAVKAMAQSGLCGFYLSISESGTLKAGDSFTLHAGPRQVTIAQRFQTRMSR